MAGKPAILLFVAAAALRLRCGPGRPAAGLIAGKAAAVAASTQTGNERKHRP